MENVTAYILIEEYEGKDGIREFQNILLADSKIECEKKLKEIKKEDEYGMLEENGIYIDELDNLLSRNTGSGFVEYKIEPVSMEFNQYILSDKIKDAMINMMKFMVSNEWHSEISLKESCQWLSSGTGLSASFIEMLSEGTSFFDEKFKAGMATCIFKDEVLPERNHNLDGRSFKDGRCK